MKKKAIWTMKFEFVQGLCGIGIAWEHDEHAIAGGPPAYAMLTYKRLSIQLIAPFMILTICRSTKK